MTVKQVIEATLPDADIIITMDGVVVASSASRSTMCRVFGDFCVGSICPTASHALEIEIATVPLREVSRAD